MNEELKKALETLIEETIDEIEDLKKSSKFSADEVKIEGPGDGIGGQEPNGKLGKEEDDEDDDKDDDMKDKDEAEKAVNREADPDGGHHRAPGPDKYAIGKAEDAEKAEDDKDDDKKKDKKDEKKDDKAEKAVNREADPDGGHHKAPVPGMERGQPPHSMSKQEGSMDKTGYPKDIGLARGSAKKSVEESSDLMKSFIDERVTPLEKKLSEILDLVNKLSNQPVAARGVNYKMQPLAKSDAEFGGGTLSKAEIGNKLFELKKSGTRVESVDVTKAELGQDLQAIVKKYNLA